MGLGQDRYRQGRFHLISSIATLQGTIVRINSVRVEDPILVRLLDLLDRTEGEVAQDQRQSRRLRFRVRNAIVLPGDNDRDIAFVVPTRNLSAHGMAFLHSHMMWDGRPCTVKLPTRGGAGLTVGATVVRCRHIRAMLHEVAVKFDQPIDLAKIYGSSGSAGRSSGG